MNDEVRGGEDNRNSEVDTCNSNDTNGVLHGRHLGGGEIVQRVPIAIPSWQYSLALRHVTQYRGGVIILSLCPPS